MSGWHVKDLIEQLEERSAARRSEAAMALGEIGDSDALPDLLRLLADPEESLWQGTEAGVPVNVKEHPRVAAFYAVKKIATPELLIKSLVNRKFPEVRAQSAWMLSEIDIEDGTKERVVKALKNALDDPEVSVKFNAMLSLAHFGVLKLDEALPFFRLNDNYVRFQTLYAVGQVSGDEASDLLINVMQDKEESDAFRVLAVRLIGERKEKRASGALINLLMDENANIREHAALSLGKIGSMVALTPLYQSLIDEDDMVRFATGIALAFLGDTRTVPFLLKARREADMYLQPSAQKALDQLGVHGLSEFVSAMRRQPMPYRADAVKIIGELKDERALLILIENLLDEEIYVDVRKALLGFGSVVIGPLVYVLEAKEASPEFKEKSIRLLLDLEAAEAIPALIKLLKHSSAEIRELSARVLGRLNATKAKKPLLNLLAQKEKESDDVIAEALLALGCLDDKSIVPILTEHLDHLNSKVRGYSISALGELADGSVVDNLIERLRDPAQDNQTLIIQALAKIGDKRAVEPLLSIVEEARVSSLAGTKGSYLGSYAVQALATLGEVKVIRLLLTEWEEELERAIKVIGVDAIPHLEHALNSERNPRVRALAAEALGLVGNEHSLGVLISALQDEDQTVQQTVAKSLQRIHSVQKKLTATA